MELFHVLNRGVEKRIIFTDSADYARFVHNLYVFNDKHATYNIGRALKSPQPRGDSRAVKREPLVLIHGWCLMKNHYHLLLSPLSDGGITAFLRRINIGYANYFNIKHDRSGTLFQGRTKKVPIETEGHFQHILHYIHLNPLDYLDGAQDWRTWQIESAPKALAHLSAYKWSSYNDYCGTKNFPSVLSPDLFRDVYGNYHSVMQKYLADSQKEFEQRATLAPLLIE